RPGPVGGRVPAHAGDKHLLSRAQAVTIAGDHNGRRVGSAGDGENIGRQGVGGFDIGRRVVGDPGVVVREGDEVVGAAGVGRQGRNGECAVVRAIREPGHDDRFVGNESAVTFRGDRYRGAGNR